LQPEEFLETTLGELEALLQAMEVSHNFPHSEPVNQVPAKPRLVEGGDKPSDVRSMPIFNSNLIGIGFGDLQGNILEANDAFLRTLGYTHEDLAAGKLTADRITPPEYRELENWLLEELQSRGRCEPFEKEYFHKNGSRVPALMEISLLNDHPYQVMTLIVNITGRRRTEEVLRDSERRYRTIVDMARDGIWILDSQARITFVNQRMAEMLGYAVEEILTHSLYDFLDREDHQEAEDLLKRRQLGIGEDFDFRFRRKDGKELWGIVSTNPLVDTEGRFIGSLGMITDITERKRADRKLRENEERFRQLADHIDEIFWIWEIETGQILYLNPAAEKIFEISCEALYENPRLWIDAIHPEDREAVLRALKEAPRTGKIDLECRIVRADGSTRWLRSKGKIIPNLTAQPYRLAGITVDRTERKHAEELLKLQAQILENLAEGVVVSDKDGRIILTNPAIDRLFGYPRGALIGKPLTLLTNYSEEENRRLVEAVREKVSREGFWSGEIISLKSDHTTFISLCSITSIETSNGQVWVSVQQDITDWKKTSEQLQEQAALINQANDAILVKDLEDRIIFWNRGAEILYGWTAAEVCGKDVKQLHFRNHVEELEKAKKALLQSGDWVGELNQVTRDGKAIIVQTHWSLLRDDQGNMKSVLATNTDITKQKEIETHLLRAQRLDSIGTLAMGIAHDINNILAPLLVAIDVLRFRLTDEESQYFLAMLKINTQRGADLINQVLTFARGVGGARQVLDLKYLIGEMIGILKGTLPKSIAIRFSVAEDLWPVVGDPTQLQQVVMNLCTNAQDAMPNGGELKIEAKNLYIPDPEDFSQPFVSLTVADTGTGIPADLLDKIFEPFFTTKEVGKGTGLGLSTVMGIIKDHGGSIEVTSRTGSGTNFQIYLPANPEDSANMEPEEEVDLPFGNQEMILLIDDEPILRELFKSNFEQFGYRMLAAGSGAQALKMYAEHGDEIKVIITDIVMPDMDGLATIQALQAMNKEVKIIAISGLNANAILEKAVRMGGVQAFLRKPFTSNLLLHTLKKVLDS
jgi:PAS domain S-box-containing protein